MLTAEDRLLTNEETLKALQQAHPKDEKYPMWTQVIGRLKVEIDAVAKAQDAKTIAKLASPDKVREQIDEIIIDYHKKQQETPDWILPVFQHTDQLSALLQAGVEEAKKQERERIETGLEKLDKYYYSKRGCKTLVIDKRHWYNFWAKTLQGEE